MIEIFKNSPSQKTRVILTNKITFKAKRGKKKKTSGFDHIALPLIICEMLDQLKSEP